MFHFHVFCDIKIHEWFLIILLLIPITIVMMNLSYSYGNYIIHLMQNIIISTNLLVWQYYSMLYILVYWGYINFIVILQQMYIMWYYHFETKNYFCLFKLYLFHNATTNNSFFASLHYICRPPFKCILVLETLSNYYFQMHGSKL